MKDLLNYIKNAKIYYELKNGKTGVITPITYFLKKYLILEGDKYSGYALKKQVKSICFKEWDLNDEVNVNNKDIFVSLIGEARSLSYTRLNNCYSGLIILKDKVSSNDLQVKVDGGPFEVYLGSDKTKDKLDILGAKKVLLTGSCKNISLAIDASELLLEDVNLKSVTMSIKSKVGKFKKVVGEDLILNCQSEKLGFVNSSLELRKLTKLQAKQVPVINNSLLINYDAGFEFSDFKFLGNGSGALIDDNTFNLKINKNLVIVKLISDLKGLRKKVVAINQHDLCPFEQKVSEDKRILTLRYKKKMQEYDEELNRTKNDLTKRKIKSLFQD